MVSNINYSVSHVQFGDRNKPVNLNIASPINFSDFYNNQLFSDLKITINDDVIHAHKFVLVQQSKYFRDFCSLSQSPEDKTLSISILFDVKNLVSRVIRYLYTNELSFNRCDIALLYEISYFYSIDSLKFGLENLVNEEIKKNENPKEMIKIYIDDYHKAINELEAKSNFLQFGKYLAFLIVNFDVDLDYYRPLIGYRIYIHVIDEMIKVDKLKNYKDIIDHTISFTDNFFDNKVDIDELSYITEILTSLLDRPKDTEYYISYEDLCSYIEGADSPDWLKRAASQIVL